MPGAGEALAELVHAGALFAVITGRPLQAARRATAALGVEPAVFACYHGALVAGADGTCSAHLSVPPGPGPRRRRPWPWLRVLGVTVWDVDEPPELEPGSDPTTSRERQPAGSSSTATRAPPRGCSMNCGRSGQAGCGCCPSGPDSSASSRPAWTRATPCASSPGVSGWRCSARSRAATDGGRDAARRGRRARRRRRGAARARPPPARPWSTSRARLPDTLRAWSCRCSEPPRPAQSRQAAARRRDPAPVRRRRVRARGRRGCRPPPSRASAIVAVPAWLLDLRELRDRCRDCLLGVVVDQVAGEVVVVGRGRGGRGR